MSWTIRHLTEEEQKAFIPEFDLNRAKEWAIMDSEGVLDFYDTEQEAKNAQADLNQREYLRLLQRTSKGNH